MKKILLAFSLLFITFSNYAQTENHKSSIDFVKVLNDNHAETLYYYQNNWKLLREVALKKNYIASYSLIEITPSEATPYNFILITTYANTAQYENREAHFEELIKASGAIKLLNDKEPKDFRKIIHGQDPAINN